MQAVRRGIRTHRGLGAESARETEDRPARCNFATSTERKRHGAGEENEPSLILRIKGLLGKKSSPPRRRALRALSFPRVFEFRYFFPLGVCDSAAESSAILYRSHSGMIITFFVAI